MLLFDTSKKQAPFIEDTPHEEPDVTTLEPRSGLVKSWSVSSVQTFEDCPYKVFLSKVKKHPEPKSKAMERGTQIHECLEKYVMREADEEILEPVKYFRNKAATFRQLYTEGKVIVEQDWAYNPQWGITGWQSEDTWCRMKLDVFVREDTTSASVEDWKTGKIYPMKAGFQAMVYAIGAFERFPELEFVKSRFLYVDQGKTFEKTYTRERTKSLKERINLRALKLTTTTHFPPKPSKWNCKFCGHRESGACEFAEN